MQGLNFLMGFLDGKPLASELPIPYKNAIVTDASGPTIFNLKNDLFNNFVRRMLDLRLTFSMMEEMMGHRMSDYNKGFIKEILGGEASGVYPEELKRALSYSLWSNYHDKFKPSDETDITGFVSNIIICFFGVEHYVNSCQYVPLSIEWNKEKDEYNNQTQRLFGIAEYTLTKKLEKLCGEHNCRTERELTELLKSEKAGEHGAKWLDFFEQGRDIIDRLFQLANPSNLTVGSNTRV